MAYFGAPETRTVMTSTPGRGVVGMSRVRALQPLGYIAAPVCEDAIMLGFQHRPLHADMFLDGRPVTIAGRSAGTTTAYDYRREWACVINTPFEATNIHLPRAVLDAQSDSGRSGDLVVAPGVCVDDAAIRGLVAALGPIFDGSSRPSTLFLDHIGWAIAAYCATTFLEAPRTRGRDLGCLAAWQERRAKEMIDARLDGDIRLADLAAACGLSVKHFARAFRRSTSVPPHRWLMQRRIERAQTLLLTTGRSIAEIALACGFGDQSHFTTVFSRMIGVPPGEWRRSRRN